MDFSYIENSVLLIFSVIVIIIIVLSPLHSFNVNRNKNKKQKHLRSMFISNAMWPWGPCCVDS